MTINSPDCQLLENEVTYCPVSYVLEKNTQKTHWYSVFCVRSCQIPPHGSDKPAVPPHSKPLISVFSHLYCGECHPKSTVIWWEFYSVWPTLCKKCGHQTINFRYVADYRNKQQFVTLVLLQFFVPHKTVAKALIYQTAMEASIYEEIWSLQKSINYKAICNRHNYR